jgi:cytochrome c oxidase subunit I
MDAVAFQQESVPEPAPASRMAVLHDWMTTVDHKKIGVMYVLLAVIFMVIAGCEAILIRLQLFWPHKELIGPDTVNDSWGPSRLAVDWMRGKLIGPNTFNGLFTMHGTTMVFFVGMPILIGVANYLLPLMIGARDMAFPRMNALGFWATLFGGLLVYFSYATGAAPFVGWFAYAPMTEHAYARGPATDFWALGLIVSGVGTVAAAINFIATILGLRAPGMTVRKVPFFVWTILWTSVLILFALPPLTATLIMILFDRNLGAHFFDVQNGGSAILWQHLFWFFGHPEVYILILPVFGMISEVIPVFSRKVLFGYEFMAVATAAITFISLGVWAHHMFAVGMSRTANLFFTASSLLISIPTGIKFFNWLATMYGGKISFAPPMLFAFGFLSMFLIGGLTGIMLAVVPFDLQLTDTYFVVGHFHWVLIGGTLFGTFAGIHYWYPKVTGRMLSARLANWQFWLLYIGFFLTFGPMHISGMLGMPRRIYTYDASTHWALWNQLATVGAVIQVPSYAILVYNLIASLWKGKPAGDDPWDAWTLEWATTSPPPPYNFEEVPIVRSRRPLWDLKHPDDPDWKYE